MKTEAVRFSALKNVKETMLTFPLYILTHPFKGFDEMKNGKRGSMAFAIATLIIAGFANIFGSAYTGFVLTGFWEETPFVNIPFVLIFTYSPILLFCIANWSVTAITNGSGSMKDIFLTYTYAMYPMIFLSIIGVAFSRVITLNEADLAMLFFSLGNFLHLFFLFIGLIVVHEYGLFRAILWRFLR